MSGYYGQGLSTDVDTIVWREGGFGHSKDWLPMENANAQSIVSLNGSLFVSTSGVEDSYFVAMEWDCCTSPGNDAYPVAVHNLTGDHLVEISESGWTGNNLSIGDYEIIGAGLDGGLVFSDGTEILSLADVNASFTLNGMIPTLPDWIAFTPLPDIYAFAYESAQDANGDGVDENGYIIGRVAFSEDFDDDNDGLSDWLDSCADGDLGWTSSPTTDYDSDGCQDSGEDTDDDDDGVADVSDSCSTGELDWSSDSTTDWDSDGCLDSAEDADDDNDGLTDLSDECPTGDLNWTSNSTTDHDSDGCRDDGSEDNDDDNDTVLDANDLCARGALNWISNSTTDVDGDGCRDIDEDFDSDNDGVDDEYDSCPNGNMWWSSNSTTDYDSDGCQDSSTEDLDDDNDSMDDLSDDCATGDLGWTSSSTTDYDSDG